MKRLAFYFLLALLLAFTVFMFADNESTIKVMAAVGVGISLVGLLIIFGKILIKEFVAVGWEDEKGFHFGKSAAEKKGETIFTLRNPITMEKKKK